jgi:hypothetical protein
VLDAGWHVKYIPVCLASGVCPEQPTFFITVPLGDGVDDAF